MGEGTTRSPRQRADAFVTGDTKPSKASLVLFCCPSCPGAGWMRNSRGTDLPILATRTVLTAFPVVQWPSLPEHKLTH